MPGNNAEKAEPGIEEAIPEYGKAITADKKSQAKEQHKQ